MGNIRNKLVAILLSFAFAISVTACGQQNVPEEPLEPGTETEVQTPLFLNPLKQPEVFGSAVKTPKLVSQVLDKYADNTDTVGWLQVPNTNVNDVVVLYPDDANVYYLRRNFEKRWSNNGIYYADFRAKVGESEKDISRNLVIYGHSMNDNPDDEGEPLFTQLKRYWEEDFARKNPYIFFSTKNKDYVYEVFSVFFTTTELNYNDPNMADADFANIVSEANKSSLYVYEGIDVSANDHIITLSTCTYNFTAKYPNKYRYVVMGRMVKEGEALKTEAKLTKNPSPKMPS